MQKMVMLPTIIPIASGKGGVGKTVLTANLGIALAEFGCETIVVDLDLGGSNLHTYLGMHNHHPGIGDHLRAGAGALEKLLVETDFPKLRFLPGDVRSPFMANITFAQKMKVIQQLKRMPADYLLLDLGAGSSFNTLDFFAMSSQGLLVTSPEYSSIMNMLTFLKNLAFRLVERSLPRRRPELHKVLDELFRRPATDPAISLDIVQHALSLVDPEAGKRASEVWHRFLPRVVFNMGFHPDELNVLTPLDQNLREILDVRVDYIGFVFECQAVRESVRQRIPLSRYAPESYAMQDIKLIADRIQRLWNQPVRNSGHLLQQNSRAIYNLRYGSEP
jgi:flagellar biosynthesis protein FlhG